MLLFFGKKKTKIFVVQTYTDLSAINIKKLEWLFGEVPFINSREIRGSFIGPRPSMISPWSTNAVEITQNMGIKDILRTEEFHSRSEVKNVDPMLYSEFKDLNQSIFDIDIKPDDIIKIKDIAQYNLKEGLALSDDEVKYLNDLSKTLGRLLTDSEVFGFSQVNSEHCRHKIFNGRFIINGKPKKNSLFELIKKTSKKNPNNIVSAYKDNVAFIEGPEIEQFVPKDPSNPSHFFKEKIKSVISLKAETHNFPTTVEPFNGAATGSGGEIRDRLAGGKGSLPLAGTAVYMTSYSRIQKNFKKSSFAERDWLYKQLVGIQKQILYKYATLVKSGGNLIYATCSIFPNENQNQIKKFLKSKIGLEFNLEKEEVLLTQNTDGDGFYVAKLLRY